MRLRIGLFCLLGGLCFTVSSLGAGHFGWWYLSGVLTCAALLPVMMFGPRNLMAQFVAVALAIVIVGLVCTMSEGALFFPDQRAQMMQSVVGGTVAYLLAAAVLVALARVLKLRRESTLAVEHRPGLFAVLMVLLSGLSYVLYYLVFGAIAFQFFTRQYYPHATEQVAALGGWFWVYQLARGILMTLAVLPIIYTLQLPRWKAAVAVGLLIWIVGGGAPLLVPNTVMVATQRYMHIVEIFTQNFSLGITAVLLLRTKNALVRSAAHPLATA